MWANTYISVFLCTGQTILTIVLFNLQHISTAIHSIRVTQVVLLTSQQAWPILDANCQWIKLCLFPSRSMHSWLFSCLRTTVQQLFCMKFEVLVEFFRNCCRQRYFVMYQHIRTFQTLWWCSPTVLQFFTCSTVLLALAVLSLSLWCYRRTLDFIIKKH